MEGFPPPTSVGEKRIKMTTQLINLTPHDIVFVDGDNNPVLTVAPSGQLARVSVKTVPVGELNVMGVKIPITTSSFGDVTGLPDEEDGTAFIVSLAVINALHKQGINRSDLYIPNESIRNDKGQVIGCKSAGIA